MLKRVKAKIDGFGFVDIIVRDVEVKGVQVYFLKNHETVHNFRRFDITTEEFLDEIGKYILAT